MDTEGARIRKLRLARGLTLEDIGRAVGVSRQTAQRYESGVVKEIPRKNLEIIADMLDTTINYIYGYTDDPYDYEKDPDHLLDNCTGPIWEHFLTENSYDVGDAYHAYMAFQKARDDDASNEPAPKVYPVDLSQSVTIPVFGRIPAGPPSRAEEYIEDYIQVPKSWTECGQEVAALQVVGESMIPLIQSGDIVVYRVQPDAESGSICICRINGDDATVKKLLKHEPHTIVLQPLNSKYEPIIFTGDESEPTLEILGKVIEVRHRL